MRPPPAVDVEVAGEMLTARADRALVWRARRTVLIADLHLGKAATFRGSGIAVPERGTAEDLARVTAIIRGERAERLIILGDFFHAKAGRTLAVGEALAAWRKSVADVEVLMIRGNHDRSAGDPPESARMDIADNGAACGPFVLRHEPGTDASGYVLAGHTHPAVRMEDRRTGQGAKAACFWFGAACGVLPAFGGFTGTAVVRPARGDRVVALVGGGAIDVSSRLVG